MLAAIALLRLLAALSSCQETEITTASAAAVAPSFGVAPASQEAAVLVAGLGDADADVRAISAELLGSAEGATEGHVRLLGAVLADERESWRVRSAAAGSLGQLTERGAGAARPALLRVAGGALLDSRVRQSVTTALAASPPAKAAGRLVTPGPVATSSALLYQGMVRCVPDPGPSTTALSRALALPSK